MTLHSALRMVSSGLALVAAVGLEGCMMEGGGPELGTATQEVLFGGYNNIPPSVFDGDPLKPNVTFAKNVSLSNGDLVALCKLNTMTAGGCELSPVWDSWRLDDVNNRNPILKGITKCAMPSTYTITTPGQNSVNLPGQWGLYPAWQDNTLVGVEKREYMTACMGSLLNAADQSVALCIIGPGGSPYSDACSDTTFSVREAGFFGDVFHPNPVIYVSGPQNASIASNGRVCANNSCRDEGTQSSKRIARAGTILGTTTKRCSGNLVSAGSNEYCTEFTSVEDSNRHFTHVFTSFIRP